MGAHGGAPLPNHLTCRGRPPCLPCQTEAHLRHKYEKLSCSKPTLRERGGRPFTPLRVTKRVFPLPTALSPKPTPLSPSEEKGAQASHTSLEARSAPTAEVEQHSQEVGVVDDAVAVHILRSTLVATKGEQHREQVGVVNTTVAVYIPFEARTAVSDIL